MEKILDIERPTQKIYTDKSIAIGTFLGGPLVAGFLIAENYRSFSEPDKARKTLIFTALASLIIFIGLFYFDHVLPDNNFLFPILFSGTSWLLVRHLQRSRIEDHMAAFGPVYQWWRALIVGAFGAAVTLILAGFLTFFVMMW